VNQNMVSPEDMPKSWMDLLDPKWNGKIVMSSPMLAGDTYWLWMLFDKIGIDKEDYFQKLGQLNPIVESSIFTGGALVEKGEYPIHLMHYVGWAGGKIKAGIPLTLVCPKEGIYYSPGINYARVKGGPHPNASLLLMNWALTDEGLRALGEPYGGVVTKKGYGPYTVPGSICDEPWPPLYWLNEDEQREIPTLMQGGILESLMNLPLPK